MALYVIVFIGSTPIGGPIVGWIAQQYGARVGLSVGGIAALMASVVSFWFQRRLRVGSEMGAGFSVAVPGSVTELRSIA